MLKLLSTFGLFTAQETITWSDTPQQPDPVYLLARIYGKDAKDATCSGSS